MPQLPQFQSDNASFTMMQNTWATQLNPLLNNPIVNGVILKNISLAIGDNNINHTLGRNLQGWVLVRQRAVFAQVFDKQDTNPMPSKTLVLNSNAVAVVDILVF